MPTCWLRSPTQQCRAIVRAIWLLYTSSRAYNTVSFWLQPLPTFFLVLWWINWWIARDRNLSLTAWRLKHSFTPYFWFSTLSFFPSFYTLTYSASSLSPISHSSPSSPQDWAASSKSIKSNYTSIILPSGTEMSRPSSQIISSLTYWEFGSCFWSLSTRPATPAYRTNRTRSCRSTWMPR